MNIDRIAAIPVLNDLRFGRAPKLLATELFVGHNDWFRYALNGMEETSECNSFEVRFIRARYGGGKTHFLRCLEAETKQKGWVTSHVELKHKDVEMDRLQTVVAETANNIELPSGRRGIYNLLQSALRAMALRYGYNPDGALSSQTYDRAHHATEVFCTEKYINFNFSLALLAAMKAYLDKDNLRLQQISDWLAAGSAIQVDPGEVRSSPGMNRTKASAVTLKQLGQGSAEELVRFYALLTLMAGYKGLLIGLDEIELIAGMKDRRRRDNSFQTLRSLVDQNDPDLQPPSTCIFIAATPFMFENPEMFPSYKALQDRIEALPIARNQQKINYRSPVVNLDLTELGGTELRQVATKIMEVYEGVHGETLPGIAKRVNGLITTIINGGYVIARPRLLCRCMIDLLEGTLGEDMQQEVARRSKEIEEARKKEAKQP